MRFNPDSTLKIRVVNTQRLDNSGLVTFTLRYQGRTTKVSALVSAAVNDEILLSWRVLKDLVVINGTLPNIKNTTVRTATTTAKDSFAHIKTKKEAKLAINNLMGEYKPVF